MEQTAVEWLIEQISKNGYIGLQDELQAKEMEAMQKSKLITDLTNSFFSNKGFKYNDENNWADYSKNYTGTIKKTELRIGNCIEAENHNRQKVIIQVDDGFCIDFSQRNNGNPIPLTEEWLIKFGFKKNTDNGDLKGNDCYYTHQNFKRCISLPNFIYDGTKLKYVHQLQNLYFALTGEELEVKNV
jgi:hypothetical protein